MLTIWRIWQKILCQSRKRQIETVRSGGNRLNIMELNVIYNEDCIDGMKSIPDESIDLIVTDPPYLIGYSRHDKKSRFSKQIKNDDNPELVKEYIHECYRILKNDAACYMFTNYKTVDWFKIELEKIGFNVKNIIVWDKERNGMGDLKTTFGYSYEFLFFVSKGQPKIRGKRIPDVWKFPRVPSKCQIHQNQKPVELIKQCIEKSSDRGAIIFDGFMGSGTTAIACLDTGRRYIGYELDRHYYEMAMNRIRESKTSKDE